MSNIPEVRGQQIRNPQSEIGFALALSSLHLAFLRLALSSLLRAALVTVVPRLRVRGKNVVDKETPAVNGWRCISRQTE